MKVDYGKRFWLWFVLTIFNVIVYAALQNAFSIFMVGYSSFMMIIFYCMDRHEEEKK